MGKLTKAQQDGLRSAFAFQADPSRVNFEVYYPGKYARMSFGGYGTYNHGFFEHRAALAAQTGEA